MENYRDYRSRIDELVNSVNRAIRSLSPDKRKEFINWCIHEFVKPKTIERLREAGFGQQALLIDGEFDYVQLSRSSYVVTMIIGDNLLTTKAEATEYQLYKVAHLSSLMLAQLADLATESDLPDAIFPYFVIKVHRPQAEEVTVDSMIQKIEEISTRIDTTNDR